MQKNFSSRPLASEENYRRIKFNYSKNVPRAKLQSVNLWFSILSSSRLQQNSSDASSQLFILSCRSHKQTDRVGVELLGESHHVPSVLISSLSFLLVLPTARTILLESTRATVFVVSTRPIWFCFWHTIPALLLNVFSSSIIKLNDDAIWFFSSRFVHSMTGFYLKLFQPLKEHNMILLFVLAIEVGGGCRTSRIELYRRAWR